MSPMLLTTRIFRVEIVVSDGQDRNRFLDQAVQPKTEGRAFAYNLPRQYVVEVNEGSSARWLRDTDPLLTM